MDDDRDTVDLECLVLTTAHAEVHGARSVREALRLAETFTPDVVVADLHMPDEDGFALLRELQGKGLHPTFLALTGRTESTIADRARAAGFAGTVTKPVDPDELVRAIVESFSPEGPP